MSPVTRTRRDGTTESVRHRPLQVSAVLWLTLVWIALWGDLSVANTLSGLALAVAVSLVFPLPPVNMQLRIRPIRFAWLALHFLYDVVVASAQVAWRTVALHQRQRNAVVAVDLRTPSDFVLTIVGVMETLVPGTVVVEVRRSTYTLYLHAFDVADEAGAPRVREQAWALERRVVLAISADTSYLSTDVAQEGKR